MNTNPDLPPIHIVRGRRVMLDSDLATLYGVTTMAFNQAIRRNRNRFPVDFLFQLTLDENAALISQFVISKPGDLDSLRSQIVTLKAEHRAKHLETMRPPLRVLRGFA